MVSLYLDRSDWNDGVNQVGQAILSKHGMGMAVQEHNPQIVGMSALLTTTMGQMKATIEQLGPHKDNVKVMVGGAPVTQKFADVIGADACAPDAATAVELANQLLVS